MRNAITGSNINLYNSMKNDIEKTTEIKLIVSFIMESGVKLIVNDLKKQALSGVPIKLITGTYLNITEPSALYLLKKELGNLIDIRLFSDPNVSFHPKTYIFNQNGSGVIYIGSSNISRSALTFGIEWNYRLVKGIAPEDYNDFENTFDYFFENKAERLTEERLKAYSSSWIRPKILKRNINRGNVEVEDKPQPRGAQIEALYELELAREEGIEKGIVVAATGVGKTYLAAFDSSKFNRILFIAHRQEILEQAENTFKNVKRNIRTTFFNGSNKDTDGKVVFASVQTLGKDEYLDNQYFSKDYFDYIIVDEAVILGLN